MPLDHSTKLSPRDRALLDNWQRAFPLVSQPFQQLAQQLDCSEADVLADYDRLHKDGYISRIGCTLAPNTVGASTLAAVAAPAGKLERVAEIINQEPGVNHNYQRESWLNLWFVATASSAEELDAALARIQEKTGCLVYDFRLKRAFHLDLGFRLFGKDGAKKPPRVKACDTSVLQPLDRALLQAIENGIPLCTQPYQKLAQDLNSNEAEVLERLDVLQTAQIIRRFGVVVQHRRVGFKANAMTVWELSHDAITELGPVFASTKGVTLCYERKPIAPSWPYTLYCMIHCQTREDAEPVLAELKDKAGSALKSHAVLFSTRCFKQRGARLTPLPEKARDHV